MLKITNQYAGETLNQALFDTNFNVLGLSISTYSLKNYIEHYDNLYKVDHGIIRRRPIGYRNILVGALYFTTLEDTVKLYQVLNVTCESILLQYQVHAELLNIPPAPTIHPVSIEAKGEPEKPTGNSKLYFLEVSIIFNDVVGGN